MQRKFHFFEYFVDALVSVSVCQVSVGSYFGKPLRQYMLLKTADKFSAAQCHLFFLIAITIIGISKAYRTIFINTADPVIADGYLMGIPAKVFNNSLRPAKRCFGINDPVLVIQQVQ